MQNNQLQSLVEVNDNSIMHNCASVGLKSLMFIFCEYQFALYKDIKERFAERPWVDVISKADLLPPPPPTAELPTDDSDMYKISGPRGALKVSVQTGQNLDKVGIILTLIYFQAWHRYYSSKVHDE